MIQKMSDANKISFMDIKKEESPVISPISNKENYMPKAKKLSSRDNGMKTDQHICSARTGVISDTGGPTKYTKAESSNTVWDTSKISRSSNELKKEAAVEVQMETPSHIRSKKQANHKIKIL